MQAKTDPGDLLELAKSDICMTKPTFECRWSSCGSNCMKPMLLCTLGLTDIFSTFKDFYQIGKFFNLKNILESISRDSLAVSAVFLVIIILPYPP